MVRMNSCLWQNGSEESFSLGNVRQPVSSCHKQFAEKHSANRKCLGFSHILTGTGYLHITYFRCVRVEIVPSRYAGHFT